MFAFLHQLMDTQKDPVAVAALRKRLRALVAHDGREDVVVVHARVAVYIVHIAQHELLGGLVEQRAGVGLELMNIVSASHQLSVQRIV